MSLLRRALRDHDDDDFDELDDLDESPLPTQPILPSLWTHTCSSKLADLAITHDSRFVIAVSSDGQVLFFDRAGRLLWNGRAQDKLYSLALAERTEYLLVDSTNSVQLWNYAGQLLTTYTFEHNVQAIGIAPDSSLIAISDASGNVSAYGTGGQRLFQCDLTGAILSLKVSSDGPLVFAASADGRLTALDRTGEIRWTRDAGDKFSAGIRLADDARCLVAGSDDHTVYALDFDGQMRWQFDAGDGVSGLAVTPSGSACLVIAESKTAYRLNGQGNVIWEYNAETPLTAAALSDDGRFSLLGLESGLLVVDHAQNHRQIEHPVRGKMKTAVLSGAGTYVVSVSADRTINAHRQPDLPADFAELFTPENQTLARLVLGQVREDFAINPHAGIMRWFTEFERSLMHHQFDLCAALLNEIHTENSLGLDDGEKQFTHSLEGAYWLLRGAAYQLREEFDQARTCYENSRALQEQVNNQDGVGQAVAALSSLPSVAGESSSDGTTETLLAPALQVSERALLDEIMARPRVLGLSEKVLEYRVAHAAPAEQVEIVLLAKQAGLVGPLVAALNVEERVVRASASAALALLDPGPGDEVLAQMLASAQSFVRWQAVRMLRYRAHKNREAMAPSKARLWPLALTPTNAPLPETLVRREEALLVKTLGTAEDMPWLMARLRDPDTDVLIAVIEAIGAVADRRALPELSRLPNRTGFLGTNTQVAAKEAAANIEKRFPLPNIEKIAFCQENPVRRIAVVQSSLFLPDAPAVYCVVNLEHVAPGTQVKVQWKRQNQVIHTETVDIANLPDQAVAVLRETSVVAPPSSTPRPGGFFRRETDATDEDERPRSPFGSGRSPFGRSNDDDDTDNRPASGGRPGALSSRPGGSIFGSRPGGAEPPRPPGSSPFGSRPGGGDVPRPANPAAPPNDAPRRPSPFGQPADHDEDQPFGAPERPSPFSSRFGSPRLAVSQQEPEPTEPNLLRRVLNRPAPPRRPFGGLGSRFGPGADRPGARPGGPPLPPLPARPDRPVDRLGRAAPAPPPERPAHPFSRPPAPASERDGAPARSPFGSPRPAAGRKPGVKPVVFSLPRPADGWTADRYQVEVSVDDVTKKQAEFKVIDTIVLTGLEPGIGGTDSGQDFGRAQIFMTSAKTIDCLVHLQEAPVNTPVTGKIYSVTSGALLGETTVSTPKQGHQAVQLSWQNPGWRPGYYRITATVAHGGELSTEIELLHRLKVNQLILCHRVDAQNGPVGTGWPFYPSDSCHCVLELEAPPPGVDIHADWYCAGQADPIGQSAPYTTTPGGDQRAVFVLDRPGRLKPGHYSVVIWGEEITRQERSFEVLPAGVNQRVGYWFDAAQQKATPVIQRFHLKTFAAVVIRVWVLAAALALLDNAVSQTIRPDERAHAALLVFSRTLNTPGWNWFAVWTIAALGYGVLFTRRVHHLGKNGEDGAERVVTLGLAFVSSAAVWSLLSYLLLPLGRLASGNVIGLYEPLTMFAPLVAGLAPLAGIVFAQRVRQQKQSAFYIAPFESSTALLGVMLVGYLGAAAGGIVLGLIGAIIGELLNVVHIGNAIGAPMLDAGVCVGFVAGLMLLIIDFGNGRLHPLRKPWREENTKRPYLTPLHYLLERTRITITTAEATALLKASLWIGRVIVIASVLAWLLADPVLLPALRWLYDWPSDYRDNLSPGLIGLSFGALPGWIALVLAVHRLILTPGLAPGERRFALRLTGALLAVPLGWIISAALLSRLPVWDSVGPAAAVFWLNRLIALLLAVWVSVAVLLWIEHLGEITRLNTKRDQWPAEKIALASLSVIAGLLLPVLGWALLLLVGIWVLHSSITVIKQAD
jgi:hypothetical protein